MLVSIGVVARFFGVTAQTIRNWAEKGHFDVVYTLGGHRRYDTEKIEEMKNEERRKTIIYARVSGHDQKEDLHRQIEELKDYCEE